MLTLSKNRITQMYIYFSTDSAKDRVYNVIQQRKNYVNYNFVTISNFMLTYYVNHTIYMNLWFM